MEKLNQEGRGLKGSFKVSSSYLEGEERRGNSLVVGERKRESGYYCSSSTKMCQLSNFKGGNDERERKREGKNTVG